MSPASNPTMVAPPLAVASNSHVGNNVKSGKKQRSNAGNPSSSSAAKQNSLANAPVFLRKTYRMIDTADPSIAAWADEGTTFVVKDTERFASHVIPEFFKHNNFSSFVRQLNFYGFRKIKSDPLRLRDAETSEESKYWKFRHEKFQQGREEWLSEIRKSNHNESADKQEVDTLKLEVRTLRSQVSSLSGEVQRLTTLVNTVMEQQQQQQQAEPLVINTAPKRLSAPTVVRPEKKRRFSTQQPAPVQSGMPAPAVEVPPPLATTATPTQPNLPAVEEVLSNIAVEPTPIQSLLVVDPEKLEDNPLAPPVPPVPKGQGFSGNPRVDSTDMASLTAQDEAMLAQLLAQDLEDTTKDIKDVFDSASPDFARSSPDAFEMDWAKAAAAALSKSTSADSTPSASSTHVEKLHKALASLPPHLQSVFVERLVCVLSNPEALAAQASALTRLANAAAAHAAQQQQQEAVVPDASSSSPSVVFSAAILEAYLVRCARATLVPTTAPPTEPPSVAPLQSDAVPTAELALVASELPLPPVDPSVPLALPEDMVARSVES